MENNNLGADMSWCFFPQISVRQLAMETPYEIVAEVVKLKLANNQLTRVAGSLLAAVRA